MHYEINKDKTKIIWKFLLKTPTSGTAPSLSSKKMCSKTTDFMLGMKISDAPKKGIYEMW